MPNRTRRVLNGLIISSIILIGLVSYIYTFFAQASADDYCRAGYPPDIDYVRTVYVEWSGRWAAHAIYALTFPHLNITSSVYNLLVAFSAPIWFGIFYIFLHILFRSRMTVAEKAFLSVLLCALYWAGMPAPAETWYWLTGSVEYQLPFLLLALSLLLLTSSWVFDRGFGPKLAATIGGAVLAALVTGLNELVGLILSGLLLVGAGIAWTQRRRDIVTLYVGVLVLALAGVALNVLAPGTAVRAAGEFTNAGDLPYAIQLSLLEPDLTPLRWFSDAWPIWMSLALVTSPWFVSRAPKWTGWKLPGPKPLSHWFVIVPTIALVAVFFSIFLVHYAQGSWAPARVLNTIYAVFLIGVMASLATVGVSAFGRISSVGPLSQSFNIAAGVMLAISLCTSPNMLRALADLPGVISRWGPAVVERDAFLRARKTQGAEVVSLKPITVGTRLFFWDDLSEDPADWRNECVARYYGVKGVSVSAP